MACISFKNRDITIEAEVGARLTDCIRKAGLHIETPCNCIASCGKCRVRAVGELYPPTEEEKRFINADDNIRLACMARVNGDVEIELLASSNSLKTINRGFSVSVEPDSIDRVSPDMLGVAVDIGTTGLSAYLVDLESGEVLNKISSLNPQTQYGGDVLTRISYCMNNDDGSKLLKEAITGKVDEIIGELTGATYNRSSVYRITIAGNTTMLHLFLGEDTRSIARAPYRPVFIDRIDKKASDLSININKNGMLTMLPSASGYIGADILAGVIATAFNKKSGSAIFIDIGTNGEIAAINGGRIAATSTAAGPALEGMNISCGCRAEAGAIDSFCIDDNYNFSYTTIGGIEPKGICGSGNAFG
ncbi:MAG: ASKHA domain-containing protein [Clostridia bacterium]